MKLTELSLVNIALAGVVGVVVAATFGLLEGLAFFIGACWNTANLACLWAIAHHLGAPRRRPWVTGGLIVTKALLLCVAGLLLWRHSVLPVGWLAGGVTVPFLWFIARTVQWGIAHG